jgi:hypothetical protein
VQGLAGAVCGESRAGAVALLARRVPAQANLLSCGAKSPLATSALDARSESALMQAS